MRLSLLQNMIDDLSWSGYSFTWIHGDDEIDTDIDIIDSMIGIFVDDGIFWAKTKRLRILERAVCLIRFTLWIELRLGHERSLSTRVRCHAPLHCLPTFRKSSIAFAAFQMRFHLSITVYRLHSVFRHVFIDAHCLRALIWSALHDSKLRSSVQLNGLSEYWIRLSSVMQIRFWHFHDISVAPGATVAWMSVISLCKCQSEGACKRQGRCAMCIMRWTHSIHRYRSLFHELVSKWVSERVNDKVVWANSAVDQRVAKWLRPDFRFVWTTV